MYAIYTIVISMTSEKLEPADFGVCGVPEPNPCSYGGLLSCIMLFLQKVKSVLSNTLTIILVSSLYCALLFLR